MFLYLLFIWHFNKKKTASKLSKFIGNLKHFSKCTTQKMFSAGFIKCCVDNVEKNINLKTGPYLAHFLSSSMFRFVFRGIHNILQQRDIVFSLNI